jgi:glutaredoxin-related protein
MAHFAKLGTNSKVIQVLTLDNKDMLNADGVEDEAVGQQYLELHNNWPAQMWIQTSYNTAGGVNTKTAALHLGEIMQV